MTIIKIRERAQITLPAEVRKALNVGKGDYLEAEVVEGGLMLKPVAWSTARRLEHGSRTFCAEAATLAQAPNPPRMRLWRRQSGR